MIELRTYLLALAALILIGAQPPAFAQSYPNKLIKMIAPFPAGGLADVFARAVGDELQKSLGQSVIVENRPGAGGNVGADVVAKADPDGYTLLLSSAGILTTNEFLYAKMPFNPAKAFQPITIIADMPMLLVVHPKLNVGTVAEFLALARAQPGKLNFGSAGVGTTGHLALARFLKATNLEIKHVAYRGAAPSVQDLVGGHIDGLFDNPPTVMTHIRDRAIRAMAVAAPRRMPQLPDVPTMAEAGVPGFEASSWFALVAPANTPKEVIAKLHAETVAVLRKPELQNRFAAVGARLVGNSPEEFAALIGVEREQWSATIKAAGIVVD